MMGGVGISRPLDLPARMVAVGRHGFDSASSVLFRASRGPASPTDTGDLGMRFSQARSLDAVWYLVNSRQQHSPIESAPGRVDSGLKVVLHWICCTYGFRGHDKRTYVPEMAVLGRRVA